MLREIVKVKQERAPGRRRWFESDGLDLIVWLDPQERVTGFQLCYDLGRGECALTWRDGPGFAHSTVDTGDTTPLKDETPVLRPGGPVPWRQLEARFAERSAELEPELRGLIAGRLRARR
jgi:hypothetical protein